MLLNASLTNEEITLRTVTKGLLGLNTGFETDWYLIDSGIPGPTVFVIGGVYGTEILGFTSAQHLLNYDLPIEKLYVVPRADQPNITSCTRNEPYTNTNMNRVFDVAWATKGNPNQTPLFVYLCELMDLIIEANPDIFFDLHEGDTPVWTSSIGCANYLSIRHTESVYWITDAVDRYNAIGRDVYSSKYINGWYPAMLRNSVDKSYSGTSTAWVASYLNIPTLAHESFMSLSRKARLEEHLSMFNCVMEVYWEYFWNYTQDKYK